MESLFRIIETCANFTATINLDNYLQFDKLVTFFQNCTFHLIYDMLGVFIFSTLHVSVVV